MSAPTAGPDATATADYPAPSMLARTCVFAIAAALVAVTALDGGAYDIVTRQEIALLIWWILGLGVLVGLLQPWRGAWTPWTPLVSLTLLGLWTAVSLGWTDSDERTVAEVARCIGYIGLLALVILGVRPGLSRPVIGGAVTAAIAVCVLAFINRLSGSGIADDVAQTALNTSRLSYPLGYWNAMGTWAAMSIAAALAASVHERTTWIRSIALAAVPLAAGTAYLTYSRTSVATSVLGVVLVVCLARRRWTAAAHVVVATAASAAVIVTIRGQHEIANGLGSQGGGTIALVAATSAASCAAAAALLTRSRLDRMRLPQELGRRIAIGCAVVACAGAAIAAVVAYPHVRDQWNRQLPSQQAVDPAARITSLSGNRRNVWTSALDAFAAHPTQGTGAGTFEFWWNREALQGEFVRDAHSLYLEALAELGWPGLLLVLTFVVSLLWAAIRSRVRAPKDDDAEAGMRTAALAILAIYLVAAGVDWMWESTAVTILTLVVAGASTAALRGPPRSFSIATRVVVPAVALLACLALLPGMVSTSLVRRSQQAVRGGDQQAAFRDARDAHNAAPWASTPLSQEALVAELTGDYRLAEDLLVLAVAKDPYDFRPRLLLARVAAENGNLTLARSSYQKARSLRPLSPLFSSVPRPTARREQ